MADSNSFYARWSPRVLSILRIVAAFLLMQHGAQKIFGVLKPPPPKPPPCACPVEQPPPPLPSSTQVLLQKIAGYMEIFVALLLLVGLFSRLSAFLLSGLLAVAYFTAHAPQGFWPILNRGELAALYSFVLLYLAVAGGGAWSLDRLLRRRKGPEPSTQV